MGYITNQIKSINRVDRVIISVTGTSLKIGSRSVKNRVSLETYLDFQFFVVDNIVTDLINAIDTQRYKYRKWKPLSINYYTWKRHERLSLNIWEATGFLKRHIRAYRKGNNVYIGFKSTDRYPQTNIRVNTVAKWLEYGTLKIPPRPLFRLVSEKYRKNVSRYFRQYLKVSKNSKSGFLYK